MALYVRDVPKVELTTGREEEKSVLTRVGEETVWMCLVRAYPLSDAEPKVTFRACSDPDCSRLEEEEEWVKGVTVADGDDLSYVELAIRLAGTTRVGRRSGVVLCRACGEMGCGEASQVFLPTDLAAPVVTSKEIGREEEGRGEAIVRCAAARQLFASISWWRRRPGSTYVYSYVKTKAISHNFAKLEFDHQATPRESSDPWVRTRPRRSPSAFQKAPPGHASSPT